MLPLRLRFLSPASGSPPRKKGLERGTLGVCWLVGCLLCFKGTKETNPLLSQAAALLPGCRCVFSPLPRRGPEEGFEDGWKSLRGSRAARR